MFIKFDIIWFSIFYNEIEKQYFKNIFKFISTERKKKYIYPKNTDILNALRLTNFKNTKVVILGQDPYCDEKQAHGLAFSVPSGVNIPNSLKNIYKEMYDDIGINISNTGCLIKWAKQGVLLLNSILTVEKGKPNSHKDIGWEIFTDKIIKILSDSNKQIIFVLLGQYAINKTKLIDDSNIITAAHPSSKSAYQGFFKSRIFSKINIHLKLLGINLIDWSIK